MVPEEWYYSKDAKRKGPVDRAALKKLLESGYVSRDDLVWKQGMAEWVKAGEVKELSVGPPPLPNTEPQVVKCEPDDGKVDTGRSSGTNARRRAFEPAAGSAGGESEPPAPGNIPGSTERPVPPDVPKTSSPDQTAPSGSPSQNAALPFAHARDLDVPSPNTVLASSCLVLLPLAVMAVAYPLSALSPVLGKWMTMGSMILGSPALILFCVFSAIYIYRAWAFVPEQQRSSSPGMMVGLLFLPLVNLVWSFLAVPGLSATTNRLLRSHPSAPPAPKGLGVAFCLTFPFAFIWSPTPAILFFGLWAVSQTKALRALHALARGKQPEDLRPSWFKGWVFLGGSVTALSVLCTVIVWGGAMMLYLHRDSKGSVQCVPGYHNARWGMTKEEVERANLTELKPGKYCVPKNKQARVAFEHREEERWKLKAVTSYWFNTHGKKGLVAVYRIELFPLGREAEIAAAVRERMVKGFGPPSQTSPDGLRARWNFNDSSFTKYEIERKELGFSSRHEIEAEALYFAPDRFWVQAR